VNVEPLAAIL